MIPPEPAAKSPTLPLLVLASVPPPMHGQNAMVAAMLAHLKAIGFPVNHVDPRLSSTTGEVGRASFGKFFRLLRACMRVWAARAKHGPFALYYVPAPPQRVPVLRDWIALTLCRPVARRTIFHWHAAGLAEWTRQANPVARWVTRRALRHADLSVVLAPELASDAEYFQAKKIAVVPNGVPPPPSTTGAAWKSPTAFKVLFLGLGNESKGLFRAAQAVIAANEREPGAFQFTFVGNFGSGADEVSFRELEKVHSEEICAAGFGDEMAKHAWYDSADALCFPTNYPNEGQPLVILEALAHDLPIIASRWRAIPGMLPGEETWLVAPENHEELVDALFAARATPRKRGLLRAHYAAHFTLTQHLHVLEKALQSACV